MNCYDKEYLRKICIYHLFVTYTNSWTGVQPGAFSFFVFFKISEDADTNWMRKETKKMRKEGIRSFVARSLHLNVWSRILSASEMHNRAETFSFYLILFCCVLPAQDDNDKKASTTEKRMKWLTERYAGGSHLLSFALFLFFFSLIRKSSRALNAPPPDIR